MLGATLLGCNNDLTRNVKTDHGETIEGTMDMANANQVYLCDIEKFRIESGIAIASNSQKITDYKVHTDTRKESNKYNYRQSILELELQNYYMKMKLDKYEPKGKQKWEIFKTEYTGQLNNLNKEFMRFSTLIENKQL